MSSGRRVVAAVDSSLAANPVLVTARALARVLGARVEAIHVTDGDAAPHEAAAAVGVPLTVVSGPVVDRLVEADCTEATAAMVIGARASPTSPHALGSTALAVVTMSTKPVVVVVPPVGRIAPRIGRVLVLVEGLASTSLVPHSVVELTRGASIDVVVLHSEGDELPDEEELLRRYCPSGIGDVQLVVRTGRGEDLVPAVADELECDFIALAWTQDLEPGRAPVVRAALERSPLPIMLIPARIEAAEVQTAA